MSMLGFDAEIDVHLLDGGAFSPLPPGRRGSNSTSPGRYLETTYRGDISTSRITEIMPSAWYFLKIRP